MRATEDSDNDNYSGELVPIISEMLLKNEATKIFGEILSFGFRNLYLFLFRDCRGYGPFDYRRFILSSELDIFLVWLFLKTEILRIKTRILLSEMPNVEHFDRPSCLL